VEELVQAYDGVVSFDTGSQTPYATITIDKSDVKPVVGGVTLTAGTYTIWYENEASLKKKLKLVTKYDIKGTGSWSLGQETSDTWNYYSLWLNGCYFADAQDHWASESILDSYLNGWVNGASATSFEPDASLTRAQAAVILTRALGLSGGSGADFDDTTDHWARAEILTARQYGLINGIGDNLFDPDAPITREQMAVLLNNLKDYLTSAVSGSSAHYTDVSEEDNAWSIDAIEAMSALGILTGFPDGSFLPQESLTRAEMTVLMKRFMDCSPVIA